MFSKYFYLTMFLSFSLLNCNDTFNGNDILVDDDIDSDNDVSVGNTAAEKAAQKANQTVAQKASNLKDNKLHDTSLCSNESACKDLNNPCKVYCSVECGPRDKLPDDRPIFETNEYGGSRCYGKPWDRDNLFRCV